MSHIVLLIIWISFKQTLQFFSLSNIFKKFELGTIRFDLYCPFNKVFIIFYSARANLIWSGSALFSFRRILVKKQGSNFDFSSKQVFWSNDNTVWPILSQTSSCTDLIFTDQPNLIVDSGVHPSLHSNCHHKIAYCKLNLNIEYPPAWVFGLGLQKSKCWGY